MGYVRAVSSGAWNLLSSKSLNIFLLVAAAVYSIMLAAWGYTSPNEIVVNISRLLVFKLLFGLLLINNLFCLIKGLPATIQACLISLEVPDDREWFRKHRHFAEVSLAGSLGAAGQRLTATLRRRGYAVRASADGRGFRAVRGRLAPLGGIVFHLSFFLLLVGIVLALTSNFKGQAVVTEGQTFGGQRDDYVGFEPAGEFDQRAPRHLAFRLDKVRPRFWGDRLLFTDLYARIRVAGRPGRRPATIRLNVPYKADYTSVNLVGYGYAPRYRLTDASGKPVSSAYVNLVVFPAGAEDRFPLGDTGYVAVVRFYPDFVWRDGKPTSRSQNVRHPMYLVRIGRGRQTVFDGRLRPGQTASFANFKLSFPSFSRWAELRIIRNVGLPVIFWSFIIGITGMTWRLLFYRREVVALLTATAGGGTVAYLTGTSDYYPNLYGDEFGGLVAEVAGQPAAAGWPAGQPKEQTP